MPFFNYKCNKCGYRAGIYYKIERKFHCPRCENELTKLISAPYVQGDYAPYNCPITGKLISGRKEHEANLRLHGCRILEPGESRDAQRRRAEEDRQLEDTLAETAGRIVANMSAAEQEHLINTMD